MNGCTSSDVLAQRGVAGIAGIPDGGLPEADVARGDVEVARLHPEVFGVCVRRCRTRTGSVKTDHPKITPSPGPDVAQRDSEIDDPVPPARRLAWLPPRWAQWSSTQRIFWTGSSRREVTRTGRRFTWNDRLGDRGPSGSTSGLRRTWPRPAPASPAAVANDAIVAQSVASSTSAMHGGRLGQPCMAHPGQQPTGRHATATGNPDDLLIANMRQRAAGVKVERPSAARTNDLDAGCDGRTMMREGSEVATPPRTETLAPRTDRL